MTGKYASAESFKQALEARLKRDATGGFAPALAMADGVWDRATWSWNARGG